MSIMETRPLSKTKRWRVTEVISSTNLSGQETLDSLNETVDINDVEEEITSQETTTPENIEEDSSKQ